MKLELAQVREHNAARAAGGAGRYSDTDVRDAVQESLLDFARQLVETRNGHAQDAKGHNIPAQDVSLKDAVQHYYGTDLNSFYKQIGIFTGDESLGSVAKKFGFNNLTRGSLHDFLVQHTSYANPMTTKDVNSEFRFIIPEIILQAIRTGYEAAQMNQNWVIRNQNMTQQEVTMPRIERGDAMPHRVNEGASIPKGSLRFGKKNVSVFKVGTGFDITDELILASSIDMMFEFLQEVGNEMSIGTDVEALRVLVNGEQADGSESAPVIGVNNVTDGITLFDIDRVISRMNRLRRVPTRIIASESDALGDLNRTNTNRERLSLAQYTNLPVDNHVLPPDQLMFIAGGGAMVRLTYRGFLVERRRNIQNQVEEMYVSDWVGFALVRRDARIILDKSTTFALNPFPAYMDIDARIAEAFRNF